MSAGILREQKNQEKHMTSENENPSTKVYSKEEVENSTLAYFNGDDFATKVFIDKYALTNGKGKYLEKDPSDMHRRIASEFARVEKAKFKNPFSEQEIFDALDKFQRIVPQGSPLYGIGNRSQFISLSNCYVVESPADSYGAIMAADECLVQISKRRGGVGVDLSHLRPEDAPTRNAARTSTGVISFASRFSNSIREVGQHGRRGALMLTLSVHHPDILAFVRAKRDLTKITGANMSVRLTDEFLKAVDAGEKYQQRWPVDSRDPKIHSMVDAKEIWDAIVENAHHMAEPGLLFWDNIIKESPADCYSDCGFETISTNPCSEIPLSKFDSCRLMLLNCFGYVRDPFTSKARFDFSAFKKDAMMLQRLMDDLVDLEIECIDRIINKIDADPESSEIKQREIALWRNIRAAAVNGRRTGSGVTGVGDMIAAMNLRYATDEGIQFTAKVYREFKLACYRSSVEMAKELGSFPVFNAEKEMDNPFLSRIKDQDLELWQEMQHYGRRNIALLTTAPCGSVSNLTQTSSGIEPQFSITPYTRRKKGNPGDVGFRSDFVDANGDHWMEFKIFPPKVKMWMEVTGETDVSKSPWAGCTANELDWKKRVELQASVQQEIDHAISSTLNLPNSVTIQSVDEIYRTAWKSGCKGITIYRDGCRDGVLITSPKETKKVDDEIVPTKAPKRPSSLECHVHHTSAKGHAFAVVVGLMKGKPYEVFACINEIEGEPQLITKNFQNGTLTKEARGRYRLDLHDKNENKLSIANINEKENGDEAALTRMISTALRHGADISFVVQQLEKVKGDMFAFSKAVSRTLKKYIPDGTEVTGEVCANCGISDKSALVRQEGCVMCKSCGWSKCS